MKIVLLSLMVAIASSILISENTVAEETSEEYDGRYSSVKIYFVHWNIISRVTLSPADVRRMRHLYIEINDEFMVSQVVDAVFHDNFQERTTTLPEPARLVIDFISEDGTVEMVYANESHMLHEDSSKYKVMNNELLNNIFSILYLPN